MLAEEARRIDMNAEALIALTRIERAADSYCCREDSDAEQILADVLKFAREGIAACDKDVPVQQIDQTDADILHGIGWKGQNAQSEGRNG
jgi:hypothetical protein